jgi:hypothetical protein
MAVIAHHAPLLGQVLKSTIFFSTYLDTKLHLLNQIDMQNQQRNQRMVLYQVHSYDIPTDTWCIDHRQHRRESTEIVLVHNL